MLILGIAAYLTFGPKPAPPPEPVLTAEARQYLPNLGLENVHMQASESYTNQRVIEILGDIENHGNRTVQQALVTCVFRDWGGQVIAQENDYIVGGTAGSSSPGPPNPSASPSIPSPILDPGSPHPRHPRNQIPITLLRYNLTGVLPCPNNSK